MPCAGEMRVSARTDADVTRVELAIPVRFRSQVKRIDNPPRLVVDLTGSGIVSGCRDRVEKVGDSRVLRVRVGCFTTETTRVVIDLTHAGEAYAVQPMASPAGLRIEVGAFRAPHTTDVKPARVLALPAAAEPESTPWPAVRAAAMLTEAKPSFASPPPPPPAPAVTPPPAPAPQTAAPAPKPAPAETGLFLEAKRVGISREVRLTLEEAITMALQNNPDLKVVAIHREEAGWRLRAARGAFDPLFSSGGSFGREVLPVSNSLGGSNTGSVSSRTWSWRPSLGGAISKGGGSYELFFNGQRFSTSNIFATLNPSYPTSLGVQFVQPLWRGRGYDLRRHNVTIENASTRLTQQSYRRLARELLSQTERAYWEVSFARAEVAVQREAMAIATRQLEANRRQVDAGQLSAIENVAAQSQVDGFAGAVVVAQENLTRAENQLKSLILAGRDADLWQAALLTEDPPASAPAAMPFLNEAVTEALAERAELGQMAVEKELNQARQRYAREELKPRVDLTARYAGTGLAGTDVAGLSTSPLSDSFTPALIRLNQLSTLAGLGPVSLGAPPATPTALVGQYGRSLGGLVGGDYPGATLELRIALPVGNRAAEAQLGLAVAESRRLAEQQRRLEQQIEVEVRNALQAVESARQRLGYVQSKLTAHQEQFQSEERRFRAGASTFFVVQQRQLSLVLSRSQLNRARADLVQAQALLDLARGAAERRHRVILR